MYTALFVFEPLQLLAPLVGDLRNRSVLFWIISILTGFFFTKCAITAFLRFVDDQVVRGN